MFICTFTSFFEADVRIAPQLNGAVLTVAISPHKCERLARGCASAQFEALAGAIGPGPPLTGGFQAPDEYLCQRLHITFSGPFGFGRCRCLDVQGFHVASPVNCSQEAGRTESLSAEGIF